MTQTPDNRPGAYYVTIIDAGRVGFLAGPFINDHARALSLVDSVRAAAESVDPRSVFYAFGTSRLPNDGTVPLPAGSLNSMLTGEPR